MSSTPLPPSASSSATDGDASAATATSVSRTRAGNAPNRCGDDRAQALGQLDVGVVGADRALDERTPQLEREERVSPGDRVDAHDHGPRQRDPEPAPQQPMDRPDRERLDREPPERSEGAVEFERRLNGPPSHRRENGHRLAVQPSQHEREHLGRAGVEPLGIVERDEHGALLRRAPARPKAARARARACRETAPSGSRSSSAVSSARRCTGASCCSDAAQCRSEQIADGRERDLRLRLGRA